MRAAALVVLLSLAACARPRPGDRPEIAFGRHECARCGMIVSEGRYAAGYVDDAGETVAYDDLGELLAALEGKPELRARAWARDVESEAWLRLGDAHPARIPGLATPMGSGWAAFSSAARAEAFARKRKG